MAKPDTELSPSLLIEISVVANKLQANPRCLLTMHTFGGLCFLWCNHMQQLTLFDISNQEDNDISNLSTKTCRICNIEKPIDDFYLDRGALYSKCKNCCAEYKRLQNIAKKNAPEKPDSCECCGKITDTFYCDHYPNTDKFRGWVCFECNTAAGYVGDSYEGVVKLFNYLYQRRI